MNSELIRRCDRYISQQGIKEENNIPSVMSKRPVMMEIDMSEVDLYLKYNRNISFNNRLFLLIDRTGQKDSDVYKKARIDRRLFSKIRSNKRYTPCKRTVIALCLALELDREETDMLLSSAGYSLCASNEYDLVVAFCIENKVFDFFDVNEILEHYGLKVF